MMFQLKQRIHMKNQDLFSLKDTSQKLKCRLLKFLFGALRVNGTGGRAFLKRQISQLRTLYKIIILMSMMDTQTLTNST